MKYQIRSDPTKLAIRIDEVNDKKAQLMEALQECSEGRCNCPTPEYEKLSSMQVEERGGSVNIELKPKPGQKLEPDDIEKCVQHTIHQAEQD
jgi:hypothetical protein